MTTLTATGIDGLPALLRLLQLVSPSLPVGAYSWSGGIEWAADAGWLRNADDVEQWVREQLELTLTWTDLPILLRMQRAAAAGDEAAMSDWIASVLATRETAELRAEEQGRGRALADLLRGLGMLANPRATGPTPDSPTGQGWHALLTRSQLAGFGFACSRWGVQPADMLAGYAWAWIENAVLAAVKILPLGQTDGQRLLLRLADGVPAAVRTALGVRDEDIGASSPALAIASSNHETQYTRLFRS